MELITLYRIKMAAPTNGTKNAKNDEFSAKISEKNAKNWAENTAPSQCGCKGIRSCLACEKIKGIRPKTADLDELKKHSFVFCPLCGSAYPGWDWTPEADACAGHALPPGHQSLPVADGVLVVPDFISESEEEMLVRRINEMPWTESQSGRRKQDFGPKVNFKKRKVRCQDFQGFPSFVGFLLPRLSEVSRLRHFQPVELCHLQYDPARGATIEPHVDDAWLWGERLVTVNLSAPTVLTLSPLVAGSAPTLRVPLPRRSLVALQGEARHAWTHAIYREDVQAPRIALTFRELSPEFGPGGAGESTGQELLRRAEGLL